MGRRDVVEMSIGEMCFALETGELTSVDLVCAYLNRIAYYDRTGICLNSVPLINPHCLEDAAISDIKRERGQGGPLEGIPFTVKDSYMVKGLPVAAGSPALKDLMATRDAATVEQLRASGAVLLGKTNMPPMAAGGVQPGLYGYARSPYNPRYINAAYGSGSSNGSATATAANFSAFGMAEETVSSGRSPASNNALVAYTPSRGVLSIRGNWPLRPTCDVVVPHTRTVEDLMRLLEVLIADDPESTGDFWRQQNVLSLPAPVEVFPQKISRPRSDRLDGLRFGVPKMYIGKDHDLRNPPVIRSSIRALWDRAREDLLRLGAEVVEVDFPVVSNYEEDRARARGLSSRGLVPEEWRDIEGGTLTAMALDQFLRENGDPTLGSWADVDGDNVFPVGDAPVHVWATRARGGFDWQHLAELVKDGLPQDYDDVPGLPHLLRGLEEARERDFEQWLSNEDLDAVIFPAAGDVGRGDLFRRAESMEHASQNGVVYSNGNRVIRHLGIPTVTVSMGFMTDIQMPVGLTFAGPAYSDDQLLSHAWAYEQATRHRRGAFLTPSLPSNQIVPQGHRNRASILEYRTSIKSRDTAWEIWVWVKTDLDLSDVQVWADGHLLRPVKGLPGTYGDNISKSRKRLDDSILIVVKSGQTAVMEFVPASNQSDLIHDREDIVKE